MCRLAASVAFLFALMLFAPGVLAQDATPAVSPEAAPSLLAGLGYPDLVLTSDGTGVDVPAEIAAGRYRVVLTNTSSDQLVDVDFFSAPEGTTQDEAVQAYKDSIGSEMQPDLFFELTIAGGVSIPPGQTGEAIIDLTPGSWYYGFNADDAQGDMATITAVPMSVTGEMPALTDPTAGVEVDMVDMSFDMPDSVPSGPHIWKVTNSDSMPHFLEVDSTAGGLTTEQVQATFGSFIGTPVPSTVVPLNPDTLNQVAFSGVLSAGQTTWIEVDLAPGQYLATCFLSGPGDTPLHASIGMFKIFDVA